MYRSSPLLAAAALAGCCACPERERVDPVVVGEAPRPAEVEVERQLVEAEPLGPVELREELIELPGGSEPGVLLYIAGERERGLRINGDLDGVDGDDGARVR